MAKQEFLHFIKCSWILSMCPDFIHLYPFTSYKHIKLIPFCFNKIAFTGPVPDPELYGLAQPIHYSV